MKVQFCFNGHKYIAPSKQEAEIFLEFWDGWAAKIFPLDTSWDIKFVERAPGWVPVPIDLGHKIEYSKPTVEHQEHRHRQVSKGLGHPPR